MRHLKYTFGAFLLASTVLALITPAASASFSCLKELTPDEKAICADAALSKGDDELAAAYIEAVEAIGKAEARKISKPLLAKRRKCLTDSQCIAAVQRETIEALATVGKRAQGSKPRGLMQGFLSSLGSDSETKEGPPQGAERETWKQMWEISEHKPFAMALLCYGETTEYLKASLSSRLAPGAFEAAFLRTGGHGGAADLAFRICDAGIKKQNFFNNDAAFLEAKDAFKRVASVMDLEMLTNCTTAQCREIASQAIKPEWVQQ